MVTADRTVLIFSLLDIFRGDIISRNLGLLDRSVGSVRHALHGCSARLPFGARRSPHYPSPQPARPPPPPPLTRAPQPVRAGRLLRRSTGAAPCAPRRCGRHAQAHAAWPYPPALYYMPLHPPCSPRPDPLASSACPLPLSPPRATITLHCTPTTTPAKPMLDPLPRPRGSSLPSTR